MLEALASRLAALRNWEATRSSRSAMKALDASACWRLCDALGRPQQRLRCVHVAGSKGKGTVATLVGAALDAAGYRVCLITSPHLLSVTERVRLGPQLAPIGEVELAANVEAAMDAVEATPDATLFDVLIAASLRAAAKRRCDWAVVECGLGGRRDSTNVLGAEVSVLTSVELEHTEVLGHTVSLIAREKAAIASRRGALVASRSAVPLAARFVAASVAKRRGARFLVANDVKPSKTASHFGASNLGVAGRVLDELGRRGLLKKRGRRVSAGLLRRPTTLAVARAALLGRRQWLRPNLLVDGAHTKESVRSLAKSGAPVGGVALIALASDKNIDDFAAAVVKFMRPRAVVCASLDDDTTTAANLQTTLARLDPTLIVHVVSEDALAAATALAATLNTPVLAFGSFRLCADLLRQDRNKTGTLDISEPTPVS